MKEWLPVPTGSGEIGRIIEEAEFGFINNWLQEIEVREGKYGKPINDKQREAILERDEWRCLVPNCESPTNRLNIHHFRWQNFNGPNQPENLGTLCTDHHMDAHPGLQEAFDNYRKGDHTAFKKYLQNNKRWRYQPVSRAIDVAMGIVWERTEGWERDDLDELFPK